MPHTLHLCEQSQHVNGTRKMHKDRWALSWLPPPGSYYLQTRSGCTAAAVANAAQEYCTSELLFMKYNLASDLLNV
ncbi:MAG: hypothetical protein FRX49_07432 [Trebouxia sp. A1-2]|nr:MAG: hypothetical protein FRX49_07432 [Trebouxia sp. A1-2]